MHLDELPERNGEAVSHVYLLNEHLKHSHVRDFASACGLTVRPEEFLDYYEEACKERDRQGVPDTGVSLDRRTLAHMREAYGDARVQTLICLVCAEKNLALRGFDRRGLPADLGEIGYRTLSDIEDLMDECGHDGAFLAISTSTIS